MELQAVMEKRRSIRNYNPERKVTKEQLEELIKAASYAPSWKNLQTSRYYCVLSENAVKELREKCLPEFNQANSDGAGAYIVTTFVKGMVGFDKNTGSPVNEAGDGWGYYDLGLQNENLLLKAAEQGLDTLVMGIRDGEALRELLNIPDEDRVITADIAKLDQVIYNFINNAINYTGDNKVIRIKQINKADAVRIEVTDNGKGISKELLPKIFDRYYRDAKVKRDVVGTGLGLSICQEILKAHGFAYGVQSEEGKGSTFWFEAKIAKQESKTVQKMESRLSLSGLEEK